MSSSQEAIIARLLLHAGMPRETETQDDLSFLLWELKQSRQRSVDPARLTAAVENIIDCLHSLNCELAEARQQRSATERMIPESLAYALSGIIRSLLTALVEARQANAPREIENRLITATEQISFAWDQFMAGDCDDLHSELREHNAMRPVLW